MGVYDDDPLADLGRLQAEMFRSVRLVVDTGLHRKRWTPGQASSYKIGHLTMLTLREDAKKRLGERFDIRAFHDVVLSNGALPLQVLEQVVQEWIAPLEATP